MYYVLCVYCVCMSTSTYVTDTTHYIQVNGVRRVLAVTLEVAQYHRDCSLAGCRVYELEVSAIHPTRAMAYAPAGHSGHYGHYIDK